MASIGNLNAKITADAQQFVSEFARADNASRRSAANIDREVDRLQKNISKKFNRVDLGKGIMQGLGIGSGFALAEQAAGLIVSHWEKAAKAAQDIEASTGRQLEMVRANIAARQTDEQQLVALRKQQAEMARELARAGADSFRYELSPGREGYTNRRVVVDKTDEERAQLNRLTEEYQKLGNEIDALSKKAGDGAAERAKKLAEETGRVADTEQERRVKALNAGLKMQEEGFDALMKKTRESNEAFEKAQEVTADLVQTYRELADPSLKYKEQMEEVNDLWARGKLKANEAADAIRNITQAMDESRSRAVDSELEGFFGEMDARTAENFASIKTNTVEIDRVVGRSADGISDAFIDSLGGVEDAWSNLGDSIIKELLRVAVQILVVKPLINSLGGMIGGTGTFGALGSALMAWGGGKATGGGVEAGVTYRVNERGQEFFKPNVGGTIIPAGIARGMNTGGNTNVTYNIDATGADQGAVQRIQAAVAQLHNSFEHRSVAAIINAKRRGGGTAGALA